MLCFFCLFVLCLIFCFLLHLRQTISAFEMDNHQVNEQTYIFSDITFSSNQMDNNDWTVLTHVIVDCIILCWFSVFGVKFWNPFNMTRVYIYIHYMYYVTMFTKQYIAFVFISFYLNICWMLKFELLSLYDQQLFIILQKMKPFCFVMNYCRVLLTLL